MTNEQLAAGYVADQHAIDAVRSVRIILLVGISGAGKDTIQTELLKRGGYHKIITHTTRAPRANNGVLEQDGREYHFVSHEQMNDLLTNHQLIEVNQYGQNFYGTSIREFEIAKQDGHVAITNIDVNGVAALNAIAPDAVNAIFLLPPDFATWKQRLKVRYPSESEFQVVFAEREAIAAAELEHALAAPYYRFIVNNNIPQVTQVIDDMAKKSEDPGSDEAARIVARELLAEIKANQ